MCKKQIQKLRGHTPLRITTKFPNWFTFSERIHVTLQFTYTENYPDEAPVYEVTDQENLEAHEKEGIISLLQEQVSSNSRVTRGVFH